MNPVLELKSIVKRFPGVLANDHVSLAVNPGEIHAILGENGAGKSTLMNVLYGLFPPDEGSIEIDGKQVSFTSPADAITAGLGMVHQHFMLIPVMTVAENVMLGQESVKRAGWLNPKEVEERIAEIGDRFGLRVDPKAKVSELPVGVQQRVEIIKVLYRQAKILILDEPTAVLTPQEVEELFAILRSLRAAGHSILFITHKLREVLELSDRVTVLRGGKVVATVETAESDESELASLMVGRDVVLKVEKGVAEVGAPILSIQDLQVRDESQALAVSQVSLEVRSGEILGIAGVQGNGQTELLQAVAGLTTVSGGKITIGNVDTTNATPRRVTELGVGHIPEDRQQDGLVLPFSIAENLILSDYYRPPVARYGWVDQGEVRKRAERLAKAFDVRSNSVNTPVKTLSGGNQQKVVVARELARDIRLLLAAQPTRGLDVGSIEYIHKQILAARDGGVAILLVSTELDEIMALSDRVAVMFGGKIVGIFSADEVDRSRLGLLMAGAVA